MALMSAVAVLMSVMVVFAPAALAHHPEISAQQTCQDGGPRIAYESVSWLRTGASGSAHNDIRIEIRVNNTGNWIEVGKGAFNAGNGYGFTGSFDSTPYVGKSVVVRARANGPWTNGIGGGETTSTNSILVNIQCTQNVSVTVNPQACAVNQAGAAQGGVSVAISPNSGATVGVYSNAAMTTLVGSFNGTGGSQGLAPGTYYWKATAASGFTLGGPSTGSFTINPCTASAVVVNGGCVVTQGVAQGSVSVTIDPASGATVQVFNSGGSPVGSFTGSGGSQPLAPGSYTWQATAGPGFTMAQGQQSGSFTIAPCSASVVVVGGQCSVNQAGAPVGSVSVTIDPTSGATVVISGPGGPHQFSGAGGSKDLAPGSYTWQASAGPGFQLGQGSQSGQFVIAPCDTSVSVGGQCQVDGNAGVGVLEVVIETSGSATVQIFDDGTLVDTLTASGTVTVPEGKTYTWSATASSGFTIDGQSSGSVDVAECTHRIVVDYSTVCRDDTPYLLWDITPINFESDQVTVTWLDLDPSNPAYSTDHGLHGEMVWPGAVVEGGKVVDWPGWLFVDPDTSTPVPLGTEGGIWIPGDDGYLSVRPQTQVQFSVNPTTVVTADYPGGDPDCFGPDPAIFVDIDSVCRNDTPYLSYRSTLSGNVQGDLTVTIHWFDAKGNERVPADPGHDYNGLPLSGSVLWPGVRVDDANEPVDWPGWSFVAQTGSPSVDGTGSVTDMNGATGKWVQSDDGFAWAKQPGAYVQIEVNPTSDPVTVTYPPGTPTCTAGPPDEVKDLEVLPFTGMDTGTLLGASILMLVAGLYLIRISRRGEG